MIKMSTIKEYMARVELQGFNCQVEKYVCFNCIENYAISDFIRSNAKGHHCNYCGREDEEMCISVHLEDVMEVILDGISSEWGDPNDEGVGWDGGWVGARVIDNYELIYEEYADDLMIDNEELNDDIIDSMNDQLWCEIDPYGLRPYEADFYSWEQFCRQVKYESRYVFFKINDENPYNDSYYSQPFEILQTIGESIKELDLITSDSNIYKFYRGRTHNTLVGFTNVKDLAPPPRERALYSNRMSPAGIPMFYGAFDRKTAIEEIRDSKEFVSVGISNNLRPLRLIDFTKVQKVPSVFDTKNRQLRNVILFLSEFVSDLSKPIDKDNAEHIEYVPTQIVTEYFRRVSKTDKSENIDGVIYPSSKVNGGICCVLFFENHDCTQDEDDRTKALSLISSSIEVIKL